MDPSCAPGTVRSFKTYRSTNSQGGLACYSLAVLGHHGHRLASLTTDLRGLKTLDHKRTYLVATQAVEVLNDVINY